MIVWITAMKSKTVRNRHAAPMNSNVNLVVVYHRILDVIKRTIAAIIPMSLSVATSPVQRHNLPVPTDGVFRICGNVSTVIRNHFFGVCVCT